MSLRTKLLLAQAPLGVVLALVGALSVRSVLSLGRIAQDILDDNYRSVLAAQRMGEAIERLDDAALLVWAGRPPAAVEPARSYRRDFEAELALQEGNITEPGERAVTKRLRHLWTDYQARFDELTRLADPAAARRLYFGDLRSAFGGVRAVAAEILAMNQDAMVRKSGRARAAADRLAAVTVGAAVGALGLGVATSTALTRRLLRPLAVLSRAARRIGDGDLTARADVRGGDELARLAEDFNAMAERLAAYRRSTLGELLQVQHASQAAIDSLPDPVVVFGTAGEIQNVNQAAETALGLSAGAVAGDPLGRADPAVRALLERVRGHVLSGRGPYVPSGFEEAVRVGGRGGDRYFLPRAAPVYESRGRVGGATVVLQDVTRLRRFDELKSDLVATVAHELRTPLTSLRMAVHLCLEEVVGPITEKQADLLHAARGDCERLQSMVDDLLDLSRLESGRVDLHRTPAPASELVESAVETHRAEAEARGVRLEADLPLDLDLVLVDRERIVHVFSNLIDNALRHTPSGESVVLRARRADGWVRFEVVDRGEGIPPEYRERVFEKFFRVPGTASGGAGLGLSIAREIAVAHGGQIGVEDAEGQGSLFWFTLPAPAGGLAGARGL